MTGNESASGAKAYRIATMALHKNVRANGHIWLLALALLLQLLSFSAGVILISKQQAHHQIDSRVFLYPLVWILALMVEIGVYWRIRRNLFSRRLAYAHAGMVLGAFLLAPVLQVLVPAWLARQLHGQEYRQAAVAVSQIQYLVFWVAILLGHCFFAWVLFTRNNAQPHLGPAGQQEDLLEGFVP